MAASDGYRNQSDPQHSFSSFSSYYDQAYDSRSYQPSQRQNSHYREPSSPRSRASSSAPSEGVPQPSVQPLNNALNNAFDKSNSARAVDPDLIAQITAEVKKSVLEEIKSKGVGVPSQAQPAPGPQGYVPQSPISTSSAGNVYTPPSPKHHDFSSHGSTSPDPLARDPMFDGAGDTPTPRHERSTNIPHDPHSRPRPPPASRMSQDGDFTPIEKMWQCLFDPQGLPTPRLGQFLRGLAVHLIDDYEPKKSLVISPSKMARFYDDVKLPDEIYPWQTIFDKLPYATLGKIYRDMRCQHHLIQPHLSDQPHIPALTPEGFEEWMTAMIQAYPDTEYERLSKAVLDMPISNADDCKERFPKELPRRLFPHQENLPAQQRCAAALSVEGIRPLRKAPTFPPPPPMNPSNGQTPSLERERSRYASQADTRAIDSDDEDSTPISIPIERERKPYTAAPGGGKVYDDELSRSVQSDSSFHEQQRRRAPSSASQSQWIPSSSSSHNQHPRTSSNVTGRRPRSPSFTNYGTRSDPNVRDIPGSYYSSMYDSEEDNRRFTKDSEKKRNEWARRQAEEDATLGGPTRRSTAGLSDSSYESRSGYDDDYYRNRGYSTNYDRSEPRRY
ncbi:hypothetical protein CC78DRAFT_275598 [Lojkania enalia]|uniref:DUF7514 domain-containing protein n=1 Tax=Lojkania enalia TaxID=147567 RepID=A0A9P4N5K3_9PLEO|nr:hypothetical protein CC78DRAFT_275598 [Didymosphaeria enalia]